MANKATIKARRRRLVVLADYLENEVLPALNGLKFDMRDWGATHSTRQEGNFWDGDIFVPVPSKAGVQAAAGCEYVGCAAGHAYFCWPLVKAGVRRVLNPEGDDDISTLYPDEEGLAEFFGISYSSWGDDGDEFTKCFMPTRRGANTGTNGIRRVAATLRKVAASEPPAELLQQATEQEGW